MKKRTLLASAILLTLTAGCGTKEPEQHYEDAVSFINEQEYKSAVIELKSAIQQAPKNAEYRLTLGRLYMQTGDSVSAEKELSRALEYGAAPGDVIIPMARALYLIGRHEDVIKLNNQYTELDAEQLGYLKTYHALAELELGDTDASMALFDELSTLDNPAVVAFAQANLSIRPQQYDVAIEQLDKIDAKNVLYPEALYLKGNIFMAQDKLQEAIAVFENYLDITPRSARTILLLAQTQVKAKEFADADKNLQLLLKIVPEQAFANYLKAVVDLEAKNYIPAKEHAEKAINNGYRTPPARIVAAIAAVNQGLNSQALSHLSAVKDYLEIYPPAQKLYSILQLNSGEAADAKSMLIQMDGEDQDIKLITATALELVKQGDMQSARELMAKYEQQYNQDAESLTNMAMLKMEMPGQEQAGIRDLEMALTLDPSLDRTRMVLAGSYIRLKQYDKANKLADSWIASPELAATGYNLKAYIALLQKDMDTASELLEKAENLKGDNPFTVLMQAVIAAEKNDYDTANTLLEKSVEQYPDYMPAIDQYFRLNKLNNTSDKALARIAETLKKTPENYQLRLKLASFYLIEKQYDKVIELLSAKNEQYADITTQHWLMLIDAQHKSGNKAEAHRLSQRWHTQRPRDIQASITYAKALAQQKDLKKSLTVVNSVLNQNDNNKSLVAIKLLLLTELKGYDEALKLIEKMPADVAKTPEILTHKGRLLYQSGQVSPALNVFLESYREQPNTVNTLYIATIYATDRSHKKAVEFLDNHFKQHEPDMALSVYYANLMMSVDKSDAQQLYKQLVEQAPDNIMLLNNYAWLLTEAKALPEARQYAEQALKLSPQNPDVLDTYGRILTLSDKPSEALPYFEKSLQARPNHSDVQINYAEALILSGNKAKAKEVLQSIKTDKYEEKQRRDELLSQAKS